MTISNAANSGVTGASPFNGTGPAVSNLNVTTLQTALGTGNVTVQSSGGAGGNGDITFVDAVAWNNANSLTVNASRHLTVNNTITNAGTGNITLNANISATGDLTINNNITTGGSITALAGRDLTLAATRTLTTGAAGSLSLQAANGVTTGTGNLNINGTLSVGTGALTLTSGINGARPNWTATGSSLNRVGATFGAVSMQGFNDLGISRIINSTGAVTISNNTRTLLANNVSSTAGAITFGNNLELTEATSATVSATNQNITFGGSVTDTTGGVMESLIVNSGTATTTFSGAVNGLNLTANAGTFSLPTAMGATTPMGNVALTSTNAMTLPAITAATITAQTTGATGDITLGANLTANAASGNITVTAFRNLTVGALSTLTTGAAGALSLQAANGVTTGTGNLNINGNLSVGTGALTLTSGINGTRPNWTATNTNLVPQSGTFGAVSIQGFQDLTLNRAMSAAGNVTLLAFRDLNLPSGSNITTSAAGSISLQAANANINGTGNLTLASNLSVANGGNLTLTSGANGTRPDWAINTSNLTVNGGTNFSNITIQGFRDITLNRAINAAGNIGVQAFRDLNLPLGSDITTSAAGSISLQAANANING
ncbi:MAG: beta strand repeat-containing protein, partial [Alphaproteobacteria bacterium]